jgi:hypothetical protein
VSIALADERKRLRAFVVASVFVLVGIGTLAPVVAAFVPERLVTLYGVTPPTDPLLALMRHRQVLLGILGVSLVAAAFVPRLRRPVLCAALASKLSFVAIVSTATATAEIQRVALGDAVAIVALIGCAVAAARGRTPPRATSRA